MMIESLADGGVKCGLPRDLALRLAAQTTLGSAAMVKTGTHPAVLKDNVTSPAGSTADGTYHLEQNGMAIFLRIKYESDFVCHEFTPKSLDEFWYVDVVGILETIIGYRSGASEKAG